MQLMIKSTLACQFKCTFCSAAKYHEQQNLNMLLDEICKIQPDDIIVTGGDPLLVDPDFYEKLLSINSTITVSFTTNLWDFYKNPKKWQKLFLNPRVGVGTSFQYGTSRLKPDGTPYTENDFIEVVSRFRSFVGYVPSFISVISDENKGVALKHLELAKCLNTTCKLNSMLPFGKSIDYFSRADLLELYVKIIDMGLDQYEDNLKTRSLGYCPFNTCKECAKLNRSLRIIDNKPKYSFCEELLYSENISTDNIEMLDDMFYEKQKKHIPTKCYCCKAFSLCHGCLLHNVVLNRTQSVNNIEYCLKMKNIVMKLPKYGFKI